MLYARHGLNNPVKFTDPSGHCIDGITTIPCLLALIAIAGFAGGAANYEFNVSGRSWWESSEDATATLNAGVEGAATSVTVAGIVADGALAVASIATDIAIKANNTGLFQWGATQLKLFPPSQNVMPSGKYADLAGELDPGMQANHLNQNAAFSSAIPRDEGTAVAMRGNAITEPGTPHYNFHQSLEEFWDQCRPNGALFGSSPTNAQYGRALRQALFDAGYSENEVRYLTNLARANRAVFGLSESAPVPRIPGRMHQEQP